MVNQPTSFRPKTLHSGPNPPSGQTKQTMSHAQLMLVVGKLQGGIDGCYVRFDISFDLTFEFERHKIQT